MRALRIGADVAEAPVTRGDGYQNRRGIGIRYRNALVVRADGSALHDDFDASLERQRPSDARRLSVSAAKDEGVGRLGRDRRILRSVEGRCESDLPGFVGCQANHDDLVDGAREDLAFKGYAAYDVRRLSNGRVEVELAAVPRGGAVIGELELEIAHRLVGHLLERPRHHLRADQLARLLVLAGKNQSSRLRQGLERLGIAGVVRASRKEGVFVEL